MIKPTQANPPLSPALRRFLYATAGTTGGAILIVEILGAKMLSPFIGTSHFVWTAQIAVTLVSLAVGYYFGGWMVDRSPRLDRLYFCIAGAAVWLCLTIPVVGRIAYSLLDINLAVGALISSAILFFVPLTLLAAVGPFLIRVLAISFHVIGSQIGRLSAISTLGSVLGTLLIGYVLLPLLPNSVTMFATSGILLALSGLYFLLWHRRALGPLAVMALIAAISGAIGVRLDLRPQWNHVRQLFRGNSDFGMLQVVETKVQPRRYYLNDYLVQNTYDPGLKKSTSLFTYMLRYLAQGYTTNLQSAFCIGLGVGIVPRELAQIGVQVEAVEINPEVLDLGQRYFDLDPSAFTLHLGDGRYFVNRSRRTYDAVILDAFLGDSSPSHLMTREAFEGIRRILNPQGVLVINSFGDFAPGKNFFTSSLYKTLAAVFPSVRIHTSGNGNVFFAASPNPNLQLRPVSTEDAHPEVRSEANACLATLALADPAAGRVLTDDFNPVDFYDAANREAHRRRLAFSIRRL